MGAAGRAGGRELAAELEARQTGCTWTRSSGRYPERLDGDYSPAAAGLVQGRRLRRDPGAARLPRRQLLRAAVRGHPRADGQPRRGETSTGAWHGARAAGGHAGHRDELAGRAELHPRAADPGGRRVPGLPVYITENGSSWHDYVTPDGEVEDYERIAYLRGHLAAVHAGDRGRCQLRGYFAWSLLDNFEWAEGYAKRFGLAFVDFGTQRRILKHSGEWFAAVARSNSIPFPRSRPCARRSRTNPRDPENPRYPRYPGTPDAPEIPRISDTPGIPEIPRIPGIRRGLMGWSSRRTSSRAR